MKLTEEEKLKNQYMLEKKELLRDFCIVDSVWILDHIESLYPNDIAIENYLRKVIMDHLEN